MQSQRPRHLFPVTHLPKKKSPKTAPAFSLLEMVAVIAILVTLMTAGVSLLGSTGIQSRKAGVDMLSGLIEQARTKAITSRSYIVLAIAEPGDLPAQDERCRVGLFTVQTWPDQMTGPLALQGVLASRWQTLNTGIALIPNQNQDPNPPNEPNILDQGQATITYGGVKNLSVQIHAIAFNPRGGLVYPMGSSPVVLRIAEGRYRDGKAIPNNRSNFKAIPESRLKIGRVTARPYQIDE
jgi:type II secretory pathway pseudopilin PulG